MRRTHMGSIVLAAAGAAGLMVLEGNQPAAGQINGFRLAAKAVTQAAAQQPAPGETATPAVRRPVPPAPATRPAPMTRPAATAPATNHRG